MAAAGSGGRRVLCYGASLTAGFTRYGFHPFGRVLERRVGWASGCDVVGLNGFTAAQMLAGAEEAELTDRCGLPGAGLAAALRSHPYESLVLLAGTNDVLLRKPAAGTLEAVRGLLRTAAAAQPPPRIVLLCTVPPGRLEATGVAEPDPIRAELNAGLGILAESEPGVSLCDVAAHVSAAAKRCVDEGDDEAEDLYDDATHLTPDGYAWVGLAVAEALREDGPPGDEMGLFGAWETLVPEEEEEEL